MNLEELLQYRLIGGIYENNAIITNLLSELINDSVTYLNTNLIITNCGNISKSIFNVKSLYNIHIYYLEENKEIILVNLNDIK